ncbi:hypothetical protein [Oryza sativa Japonica Group]|uniref:Uncharacterized protein n=1 Tax=Oryza sativa subsp. japonica TaxID=39947 RepID=Q9FTD2_ORYSJ|nr:hypothetical protein [Oryza sativa Japonica Group]
MPLILSLKATTVAAWSSGRPPLPRHGAPGELDCGSGSALPSAGSSGRGGGGGGLPSTGSSGRGAGGGGSVPSTKKHHRCNLRQATVCAGHGVGWEGKMERERKKYID